jgi:D-alanyl-D-alanine carboxypeptidase
MTLKAKALGMASTTYVNSSGLPAEEQITTARDQVVLGRAIQHRFREYYRYFATPSFRYKGAEIHNHNSLLGQVKGVDGIKTGYTEASGYNLVSSVRRDERHIVAVVLGGTSNATRDRRAACGRPLHLIRRRFARYRYFCSVKKLPTSKLLRVEPGVGAGRQGTEIKHHRLHERTPAS